MTQSEKKEFSHLCQVSSEQHEVNQFLLLHLSRLLPPHPPSLNGHEIDFTICNDNKT